MENKTAILTKDIYSAFNERKGRKVYGRKKDKVNIISTHGHVLIVENKAGKRFPVNSKYLKIK